MKCARAKWLFGFFFFFLFASLTNCGSASERGQKPELMAKCWQDLASVDAEVAYKAKWQMVRNPDAALPFLAEHLKVAAEPDVKP